MCGGGGGSSSCLSPIVVRQCEHFFGERLLLRDCFCCSTAIAAAFLAVYLLITYLIAFAFELLWILESATALPTAAVLLCAGYFTLALFAALLIHGLATKNTLCLISWMFAVTVLTFPEAGMVIFMSIQYWRIESLYGITELTCWLARILANVVEIVLVQQLYAAWKEEEVVAKRLRDLSLQAVTIPRDAAAAPFYRNNAFAASMEHLHYLSTLKRTASTPQLFEFPNNMLPPFPPTIPDFYHNGYQFTTASEFNASIFVPQKIFDDSARSAPSEPLKKSQSLMDLRGMQLAMAGNEQQASTHSSYTTLSLGRQAHAKLAPKFASMDVLADDSKHMIRNRSGFYAQPVEHYGVPIYYGPLDGPDFLVYKKQVDKLTSRNSLTTSNASVEDVQKYRDVAL